MTTFADLIRSLDYTVIFARDMLAMRRFYGEIMCFPLLRELGPKWSEFRVGSNTLALTERGLMFDDPSPAKGTLSLQLAFRVAPPAIATAAALLAQHAVAASDVIDQPWGHRTLFFRDPDGNVLEFFAEI